MKQADRAMSTDTAARPAAPRRPPRDTICASSTRVPEVTRLRASSLSILAINHVQVLSVFMYFGDRLLGSLDFSPPGGGRAHGDVFGRCFSAGPRPVRETKVPEPGLAMDQSASTARRVHDADLLRVPPMKLSRLTHLAVGKSEIVVVKLRW